VLTLAMAAMPLAQADIVVNGNFDANSPPSATAPLGWVFTPASDGTDFLVGPGPGFGALSAPNSANFGAVGSTDDVLSQVLSTVAGDSYVLDFWLAHEGNNNENDFSASFGGTTVLSLANQAEFGYTEFTFTVTASGPSTTLTFAGREVPGWYDLDNVSVDPVNASTPEPAGVMLLGTLIGLVGWQLRSRATQS
jgi:hypothetical protein